MCGILLTLKGNSKESIIDSISHRGTQKMVINAGEFSLCHHRLPIQTEDHDAWGQPIEVSNGIYLMFNGEIFNYDNKRYGSDTEYLVNFFSSLRNLNIQMFSAFFLPYILNWDGFWAVVLYDSNTDDVICFTDPLGKKLLYINDLGEICSEIKGLVRPEYSLDESYISSVRKWGYNRDNKTPYNEIKRILPNTIYSYNLKSPMFCEQLNEYYKMWNSPIQELVGKDYETHMNWLWDKMVESVNNRLVSKNYPISVLISGGLDSSIIAAILKSDAQNKINWFSIENGEKEYVDVLKDHLKIGVTYLKYEMDESLNAEIYSKWNETPVDLGSVIPQYHLFKSIKDHTGHRIVISGDGADELFGGYSRIHEYDSQRSDVFEELSYYHLPRLDKLSMANTLELRSPFLHLDIVRFALHLPLEWRKDKKILKDTFSPALPNQIVDRKKVPLKNPQIVADKIAYRHKAVDLFLSNQKDI